MNSFKYIEHTADIAIYAKADNIENLFIQFKNAFYGIFKNDIEYSSRNESTLFSKKYQQFCLNLNSDTLEELLVDFLNELNFLLLVKKIALNENVKLQIKSEIDSVNIIHNDEFSKNTDTGIYHLKYSALPQSVKFGSAVTELKAFTYHNLSIKKEDEFLTAKIIVDV